MLFDEFLIRKTSITIRMDGSEDQAVRILERVAGVCRTNIESLHNLRYLMGEHINRPAFLLEYLQAMEVHLQAMTDELCRHKADHLATFDRG